MNSDKELVEHFTSCLRSSKLRNLSESISPNFVFSSPRVNAYSFDQFCQHLEDWSINIEIEIIDIEQDGNVYIIDLILHDSVLLSLVRQHTLMYKNEDRS